MARQEYVGAAPASAGWTAGVAAATLLAGVVVPPLFSGSDTAREPAPTAGTAGLQLLPTDELLQRFEAQLPGTSTPVEVQSSESPESVMIQRQLTNADGETGLVQVDASVSAPYDADGIAENKAFCREMHQKVGPRDGSDCVIVPGGMVEFWDDTVSPEDPAGNAPGIRLTYAYFMRWDGGNVNLRTLNSTSARRPARAGRRAGHPHGRRGGPGPAPGCLHPEMTRRGPDPGTPRRQ